MKGNRARTHVSVLFGHKGSFSVCVWSRINVSNSLPGQRVPGSGPPVGNCQVKFRG